MKLMIEVYYNALGEYERSGHMSEAPGRALEDLVHRLLTLQGWHVVREHLCGHKKIDRYAEKRVDFGRMERIAVECKDLSRAMNQTKVATVLAEYRPLVEVHIDRLILVSREGVTPSAKTLCEQTLWVTELTLTELLNSIIDLTTYLHGLLAEQKQSGLQKYYVPAYATGEGITENIAIEEELLGWLNTDDARPVAILAGYGMGKTTLANRIAFRQAEEHIRRPDMRIPILIKLQDIGTEQSLEGLIGKIFTSQSVVPNYSFGTFMALNSLGRFCVLLDGFDEMKQAMSWEMMRYNFEELNRLFGPESKVILTGRPTAFVSEAEYQEAIHGMRQVLGSWKRIPGWPDYREVHLLPFSRDQIKRFVPRYAAYLSTVDTGKEVIHNRLLEKLEADGQESLLTIASRPVQLRMLLEILPDWGERLDQLTRTLLYSEFIDLIIRREMKKRSRKAFGAEPRRRFARELAFLLWQQGSETAITYRDIPNSLFSEFSMPDMGLDEIRRDLLAACFVEKKEPQGYYFPHKSFQEFLVAEKLSEQLRSRKLKELQGIKLNDEVVGFVAELMGTNDWIWIEKILRKYRGILPDWVIELYIQTGLPMESLRTGCPRPASPWDLVCVAKCIELETNNDLNTRFSSEIIRDYLGSPPVAGEERVQWARLLVVLLIIYRAHFERYNIDIREHLIGIMTYIGTIERFGRKKIRLKDAVEAHRDSGYCELTSWGDYDTDDIFRLVDKSKGEKPHGGRPKQQKHPHRRQGVTPKKEY